MTTNSPQQQALLDINDQIKSIQHSADLEGRELSPAERTQVDRLFDKFRELEADIEDAASHKSQGRMTAAQPIAPQNSAAAPARDPKRVHIAASPKPMEGRHYGELFGKSRTDDRGGFKSHDEFLNAIHYGLNHGALMAANNVEGIGADGGFLVPSSLTTMIHDAALEQQIVLPLARTFTMPTNELSIAALDVFDHSSDIANLQGGWIEEAGTGTAETAKFVKQTLRAHKLMLICKASNELLSDGIGFEQQLSEGMSRRLAYKLDQAFLYGTGAGQPTGLLNSASTISVPKASGQAADTIVMENLSTMYSRMAPACHKNAVWLMSPSVMLQIITMSWTGATVTIPGWMPATTGIAGSPPPTIFGIPVIVTEHCKPVGDVGDIILADLTQYAVGMRADFVMAKSMHEGFMTDESAWRLTVRVDGQSLWPEAVTPVGGDSTLSCTVTLDARA